MKVDGTPITDWHIQVYKNTGDNTFRGINLKSHYLVYVSNDLMHLFPVQSMYLLYNIYSSVYIVMVLSFRYWLFI